MSREHLIQMLLIDSLEHIGDMRRYLWLQRALESGFRSFANMSNAELTEEIRTRRLDPNEDATEEDTDDNRAENYDGDVEVTLQAYVEQALIDAM